jgi:parallel beta-helix repeat protein
MKASGSAIPMAIMLVMAVTMLSIAGVSGASGDYTAPISINGDADLVAQAASDGWPGDGTRSNPYIISDTLIEGPDSGLGIFVSGTTKYLIIENCVITNTTSFAIDIVGASHVTVRDSSLYGCFCGIAIFSSSDCAVTDNSLYRCQTGIELMSSDNIQVSGSTIRDAQYNGIELFSSSNNTMTANQATSSGGYGLCLSNSNGNTIYGNIFENNNGAGTSYSTEHAQAFDLGTNAWSFNGQGNTWSDWSSVDPYPYEGSAAADDILNSFQLGDALPIIAVAVVAVIAVAAVLLVKRKSAQARQNGAPHQQPCYPPPTRMNGSANQSPMSAPRPSRARTWVPAVAGVAIVVAVVLVAASTMGWLPLGSSKLSGARDIGGEWEGTGSFWSYNIYGEKAVLIEAAFHMEIALNGNDITGVLDIYPTEQTPMAELFVLEPENHLSIVGNYEITTLTFESYNTAFEFEFLTDMATGQMANTDDYAYLGLGSENGAIHLQRA